MLIFTIIDALFVFEAEVLALLTTMAGRFFGRLKRSQQTINKYHEPPELNFSDQYSYTLKM